MDLNELVVFVRVVQAGSIRKAAELLGMPKSTVSRKVIELEERLDSRLLQRTTRKLRLTDIGRIYYDHSVRIVSELENAERAVRSQHDTPRGLLRVTTPVHVAFLGPIVSEYLARYPEVRLDLCATARNVDLIEEGYDLAIRSGPLTDSSLIARNLGNVAWWLVATPGYLGKRGRPVTPSDLTQHDCLLFGRSHRITLERNDRLEEVTLTPRLLVTDFDVLKRAMTDGLGITLVPAFLCAEEVGDGRLERVLDGWTPTTTSLHVVYPSARHISPTVRTFIDHLQATDMSAVLGAHAES
jgi:DNA-binding transcriptional LysR family regulator